MKPFRSNRTGILYTDEDPEQVAKEPKMRLGMNVTDEEYYRRTSQYTAIPDDIVGATDFLRALNIPKNVDKVYAELEKLNVARKKKGEPEIQYAQFKGNVKASDSNTLVRLLLYVPGEPSKWFSIGLPSDSGIKPPPNGPRSASKRRTGAAMFISRSTGAPTRKWKEAPPTTKLLSRT